MPEAARAVLTDIYDAWRAQDIDWLASYLPDEFSHTMLFPTELHPLAGVCRGKKATLQRWRLYGSAFEIVSFDTSDLIVEKHRAGVDIALHYRHKQTGEVLITTKANFWIIEDAWPVSLTEYYDVAALQSFTESIRRAAT